MIFEDGRKAKRKTAIRIFSLLFALGLCIGGASALRSAVRKNSVLTQTEPLKTSRHNTTETTTLKEDAEVNVTVTGVPDERKITAVTEDPEAERRPYTGNFALPMGSDIIRDYSDGELVKNALTGDWRTHNGIDFGGREGNTVSAIQDGKVIDVYTDSLWGTTVVIDHGCSVTAFYKGLKKGSTVSIGDEVKKHGEIAKLGTIPIEADEGAHLHLEIKVNDEYADPLDVMGLLTGDHEPLPNEGNENENP